MAKNRDPLVLSPHWHLDCRLEGELPEDTVVGRRFLANAVLGSILVILSLLAGWLAYKSFSLRFQIHDWEERIAANRAEVVELQKMQSDYRAEADKIDQVYPLMNPPLFVSGFVANLGRTLPAEMTIDVIESNDTKVAVRGTLRATSERGTLLISAYLDLLRADPQIGPNFRSIVGTGFERNKSNDALQNVEITFYFKPPQT
jgi:hypothetical protein